MARERFGLRGILLSTIFKFAFRRRNENHGLKNQGRRSAGRYTDPYRRNGAAIKQYRQGDLSVAVVAAQFRPALDWNWTALPVEDQVQHFAHLAPPWSTYPASR